VLKQPRHRLLATGHRQCSLKLGFEEIDRDRGLGTGTSEALLGQWALGGFGKVSTQSFGGLCADWDYLSEQVSLRIGGLPASGRQFLDRAPTLFVVGAQAG
jgi:hypothetical protein